MGKESTKHAFEDENFKPPIYNIWKLKTILYEPNKTIFNYSNFIAGIQLLYFFPLASTNDVQFIHPFVVSKEVL